LKLGRSFLDFPPHVNAKQSEGRGSVQMPSLSTPQVDSDTLNRLAENERHFHTIQAGIRGLSSTWTLAAFASIAILLKQEKDVAWLFPPFALVILISLMANIGLSVLWIIDQLVYQRLFNTNYIAGIRLEKQFSVIPPVRAIQALSTRGSIASWVKFFYVGPMLPLAGVALVAALIFSEKTSNQTIGLLGYAVALLSLAPIVWVILRAREVDFFRFAASLPSDYSVILKKETCLAIIDRHVKRLNTVNASEETADGK
jgi:hypothetical protein